MILIIFPLYSLTFGATLTLPRGQKFTVIEQNGEGFNIEGKPFYNEEWTIEEVFDIINRIQIDKEIIIINGGSSIGTKRILEKVRMQYDRNVKIIY